MGGGKRNGFYGPCGAAMLGGLYTLNCCCELESVVVVSGARAGGGDAGSGTAAAAVDVLVGVGVDDSVLGGASGTFDAVDARVGGGAVAALGVDIWSEVRSRLRHLCGTKLPLTVSEEYTYTYVSPRPSSARAPQGRAARNFPSLRC